ncbi:MAG: hypothetical protein AAFN93_10005 [Bacteroidota bacterium]
MKHIIVNNDFVNSIKALRAVLPKLSFGLLITTYVISALIMGIFHAQDAPTIGFTVAAFLVPLAIQAGRGTLVFFFQLNPIRIQQRFSFGIIAATVLLILSLVEAYLVLQSYGYAWIVSVATLMIIGWVVEIMILKETAFATKLELYQHPEQWKEIKSFYLAEHELEHFLANLKSGTVPTLDEAVDNRGIEDPVKKLLEAGSPLPIIDEKLLKLLQELKTQLEGNVNSPSLNGVEKG